MVVQPLGGSSPWQEYLDRQGEGLIGITVPMDRTVDAQRVKAQFQAEGIGLLASACIGDKVDWFCLDTQDGYKCLVCSGVGSSWDAVAPARTYPAA